VGWRTQAAEPSTQLLAGKGSEENAARQLSFERGEDAGQLKQARGTGGVVVGSGMELADQRWGERSVIAASQVVVVRAQDDVLVGLAGQIGEHVADHGMFLLDSGIKSDVKSLRKSEGRWIARVVNLMLQVEEVFSLGAEPGSRGIIFDLDNGDADVSLSAVAAEMRQQIFLSFSQCAVQHDDGDGAMLTRQDGLGDEVAMG